MGKENALRGYVSWLVEPLYGKRIHRLVQSTHHQGAQALANTHRLSLAALVTPVAWSVATMNTAPARSEFASWLDILERWMPCSIALFLAFANTILVWLYPFCERKGDHWVGDAASLGSGAAKASALRTGSASLPRSCCRQSRQAGGPQLDQPPSPAVPS